MSNCECGRDGGYGQCWPCQVESARRIVAEAERPKPETELERLKRECAELGAALTKIRDLQSSSTTTTDAEQDMRRIARRALGGS